MTDGGIRAEQALLGAILLDPAGQQHLLDLAGRGDMRRPWHGQVLAAMRGLRQRGVLPGPAGVYGELKKDPDLPRSVSHDAVPLANLMEAAPRSAHAPAYAAMVIGGGIRQRLTLAGSRMTQAAAHGSGEPLDVARQMAAQARRELDACRARWEALPAPMRQELPVPGRDDSGYSSAARQAIAVRDEIRRLRASLWQSSTADLTEQLASIAQQVAAAAAASASQRERQAHMSAAREPRPAGRDAEAAGAAALRDLAADPSQITEVRDWLRPAHFARPEHGQLYAVMRDLHEAGMPVDPVTVTPEAARSGLQVDPGELAGGTGAFAAASTREVHRRAELAQIEHAGLDIQAACASPALSPRQLMQAAGDRLRQLDRDPGPQQRRQPERDADVIILPRAAADRPPSREPGRDNGREATA